jgi:hypothetical protein
MRKRLALLTVLAMVVTAATAMTIVPAASAAPPTATISNTISGTTADGLNLTGTLSNIHFVNLGGGQGSRSRAS